MLVTFSYCHIFFQVRVRALYEYLAQREDELSFCRHAVINNVVKEDVGW